MIAIAASAVLAGSTAVAQTAPATPPAATSTAPYYTVEDSTLGDLLDSPATKAVLAKNIPDLLAKDGIDRARGMTLAALQQYASDMLTDEKLKAIDKELAAIPAPKP
jgi:hypothetical protein